MNRYNYIIDNRLDTKRKRMRRKSSLPPKISRSSMDIYIISRDGDRLDNLAYEYYEDVSQWWVLAHANSLGKGTMDIPPGMRIRIPAKRELHELLVKNEKNR